MGTLRYRAQMEDSGIESEDKFSAINGSYDDAVSRLIMCWIFLIALKRGHFPAEE